MWVLKTVAYRKIDCIEDQTREMMKLSAQVIPDCVKHGLFEHVKGPDGTTIKPELITVRFSQKGNLNQDHETRAVNCAMKRGDLLLMNRFTPHRGQH